MVDVDDGSGTGLRSILRQVVAATAGDEAVLILARELIAICCAGRVDCPVGIAFHGGGRHGDDRKRGQPLFEVVIFPLAIRTSAWKARGRRRPRNQQKSHAGLGWHVCAACQKTKT